MPRVAAGARRLNLWSNILSDAQRAVLTAGKSAGTIATGVQIGESLTLVRTRGQLAIHFDPTSIADVVQVGVGLGVYASDAFAAGAASMPGPLSDAGWDWVYHKLFMFGPAFTATETGDSIVDNIQMEVDSKAMRKLKDNQVLGWMFELIVISGGGTVDIAVTARHLFKLS